MINQQNFLVKANNSFQNVNPFPVGFVYSSMNSTSPASIYGGSWTAITGIASLSAFDLISKK